MSVSIKMTASQKTKLAKLGGPDWVRKMIDLAKAPKEARPSKPRGSAHG